MISIVEYINEKLTLNKDTEAPDSNNVYNVHPGDKVMVMKRVKLPTQDVCIRLSVDTVKYISSEHVKLEDDKCIYELESPEHTSPRLPNTFASFIDKPDSLGYRHWQGLIKRDEAIRLINRKMNNMRSKYMISTYKLDTNGSKTKDLLIMLKKELKK